ncbi:MAG: DUF488 domain-containing protein, partial [Nitrospirae bacterium]
MKRLWSLGTSSRTQEEFLDILRQYGLRVVVDLRRFPTSRLEHFKRENLKKILESEGFRYVYLGDQLGGFRKGGYQQYMNSEAFKEALKRLLEIASREPTVMICAEKLPWRCHRRWVAQAASE